MSTWLLGDDALAHELLAAVKPPPNWVLYRTALYSPHSVQGMSRDTCLRCPLLVKDHKAENMRVIKLLTNGPLRRLSVLTQDEAELPRAARNWLSTMYNIAEAAGVRVDGWIAYDGRG